MDAKNDSASAITAKGFFSDIGLLEGVVIADTAGLVILGVWSLSNFRDQRDSIKTLTERVKELEERCAKMEARLSSVKKIESATKDNINKIKGHSTRIVQLEQAQETLDKRLEAEREHPTTPCNDEERRICVKAPPKVHRLKDKPKIPTKTSVSSSSSESDHPLSEDENSDDIFG